MVRVLSAGQCAGRCLAVIAGRRVSQREAASLSRKRWLRPVKPASSVLARRELGQTRAASGILFCFTWPAPCSAQQPGSPAPASTSLPDDHPHSTTAPTAPTAAAATIAHASPDLEPRRHLTPPSPASRRRPDARAAAARRPRCWCSRGFACRACCCGLMLPGAAVSSGAGDSRSRVRLFRSVADAACVWLSLSPAPPDNTPGPPRESPNSLSALGVTRRTSSSIRLLRAVCCPSPQPGPRGAVPA